jgi:hypothetical protein
MRIAMADPTKAQNPSARKTVRKPLREHWFFRQRELPHWTLRVLILALVLMWATMLLAGGIDNGGSLAEYIFAAQNDHRPITLDVCASACTVKLKTASCINADTMFFFHLPFSGPLHTHSELAALWLASEYTPALSRWYLSSTEERWLSGAQLAKFGYRVCN